MALDSERREIARTVRPPYWPVGEAGFENVFRNRIGDLTRSEFDRFSWSMPGRGRIFRDAAFTHRFRVRLRRPGTVAR